MDNNTTITEIFGFLFSLLIVIGAIFGLITFTFDFVRVDQREAAVITRFGKVTRSVSGGWFYKTPIFSSHAATYDLSVQTLSSSMEGTSKDQQAVKIDVNVLYRLNENNITEIYNTIGGNGNGGLIKDTRINDYITPMIQDTVKTISAEFTATEQLSKRNELSLRIVETLKPKLAQYYILVDTVNITNINFSPEFNQAIERKVVAQQLSEQKKFELEAERNQLEVERVKAETITVQGEALRANPEVLEKQKIDKWDGKLPTVQGNNDTIIDLR